MSKSVYNGLFLFIQFTSIVVRVVISISSRLKEKQPVLLSATILAVVAVSPTLTLSEQSFRNVHKSLVNSLILPSVLKSVMKVAFQKHLLKSTLVAFFLICTSVVCLSSAIFIIPTPLKIHNHSNGQALRFLLHQSQVLLPVRQLLPIILSPFSLPAYHITIAYVLHTLLSVC